MSLKSIWLMCTFFSLLAPDKLEIQAALTAYSKEDFHSAAKIAEQLVLQAEPSVRAQALLLSANCYAKLREIEKLISALEAFCDEYPERKEYRQACTNLAVACRKRATITGKANDHAKAARWLACQLGNSTGENPQLLFELGDSYAKCNDFEKALQCFQRLLENSSDTAWGASAHYELARIHDQQHCPEVAIGHFEAFLKTCDATDIRLDHARLRLASLFSETSQLDRAIQLYALVAKGSRTELVELAIQSAAELALKSKNAEHLDMAATILGSLKGASENSGNAKAQDNFLWTKSALYANIPSKQMDAIGLYEHLAESSPDEERRAMSQLNASILADRLKDAERAASNALKLLQSRSADKYGLQAKKLMLPRVSTFSSKRTTLAIWSVLPFFPKQTETNLGLRCSDFKYYFICRTGRLLLMSPTTSQSLTSPTLNTILRSCWPGQLHSQNLTKCMQRWNVCVTLLS